MEKKTIWQCHNPNCNAQYGEYINGCPKCSREPGESHKVSILNKYHPAFKGGMPPLEEPHSFYQPLFDHMHQEHGLTLLESEMADIIHLVEKMQLVRPQGAATDDEIKAAWKKRMGINFDEYGAMQDYCFYQQGYDDAASVIRQGAVWVKGTPPTRKFHHARFRNFGSDEIAEGIVYPIAGSDHWVAISQFSRANIESERIIEYLDESATSSKDISNLLQQISLSDIDAPAFAHTTQFREHFDYIKRKLIEIIGTGSVTTKERDEIELSAFFQEGAECWKLEYEMCRKLLQELVDLKNIKETEGKTEDYNLRQPVAWINAKKFLEKFQYINW